MPKISPFRPLAFVPVSGWSFQAGTATVADARTGHAVTVAVPLTLVGDVVCARGVSLGVEDGMARVRFPDGQVVWARTLKADPGAAA